MLKICDIKNIQELKTLHERGVEFVGFHLITQNDFKRKRVIQNCIEYLHSISSRTKAILITKEKNYQKLKKIIDKFEFDGIQLHYQNSKSNINKLRAEFNKDFIIFEVISTKSKSFKKNSFANFLLLDSSFVGGTGKTSNPKDLERILNLPDKSDIFLAGGIREESIPNLQKFGFVNFDIQSGVKTARQTLYENINFNKLTSLLDLLNYKHINTARIGTSVKNKKEITKFINFVDFLHLDISDGFVGEKSDTTWLKKMFKYISSVNSHIHIQVHIFAKDSHSVEKILNEIGFEESNPLVEIFIHINKDNYIDISNNYFPALDVSDILDETFPIEMFFKEKILICLQNKRNSQRVYNLNLAIKYILGNSKNIKSLYIDRGVDLNVIESLDSVQNINPVIGTYFMSNGYEKYKLIKEIIYAK